VDIRTHPIKVIIEKLLAQDWPLPPGTTPPDEPTDDPEDEEGDGDGDGDGDGEDSRDPPGDPWIGDGGKNGRRAGGVPEPRTEKDCVVSN